MKLAHIVTLSVLVGLLAGAAMADVVQLKNGDRLTGTITDSDNKTLVIKTDYAGDVTIQWSAIQGVTSGSPIYVSTTDRGTISGTVTPSGSNLVVRTASASTVEVPWAAITAVRSSAGQAAYEKTLHPSLIQGWNASANIGFALARGNSETTNLNTGFNADRKTLSDNIAVYESSIYTTDDAPGGGVTANAILGGARYDRNIKGPWFAFVSGDFTHDELQDLDLRSIYSGGLGWHAINRADTTLDVLAGVNYTRESYGATPTNATINRNLPGLTFGEDFAHKFNPRTSVTEHFYFYPDLSDTSQYRMSLDASGVTKINNWLGWQVSISDRYVTNPPVLGTKSNDLILSTGLTIALVQPH
jgi:putative salt-induced outer membrane protein YdiY